MKPKRTIWQFLLILVVTGLMSSCKLYKQDVMFQLDEDFSPEKLSQAVRAAQANYKIQPNDLLSLEVFSNGGELIIDPNFELLNGVNAQGQQFIGDFQYLVQYDGRIKLPMIGLVNISGLTLQEAEDKLEKLYDASYQDTFVKLQYLNKRAFVLGANGGAVIPLPNDNMSIIEVITLAGGMPENGKAQNIRLIRGMQEEGEPQIFVLDLSRLSRIEDGLMTVKESDVLYIEPWKRPVNQAVRDFTPILSVISSILAIILIIDNR